MSIFSHFVFFHVDMDAFYASIEQTDNPQYKGFPVIVGGPRDNRRSVVSTCSYEARKYGVHSAMPMVRAKQLCPQAVYLPVRMSRYHEKSQEIMTILRDFSPDVQQISIDEAFIDMTGTERLFGPPQETAFKLKRKVAEQTGLTVSVGIGTNKYIAKIASGLSKPDGFVCVYEGEEQDFMLRLPLKKLWGIGDKTLARLNAAGLFTTADVMGRSRELLCSLFGNSTGAFLYRAVRGIETETFSEESRSHSISSERTFSANLLEDDIIDTALLSLCQEVMFRLLDEQWHSKTVHVKIRYEDFTTVSISETAQRCITSADDLFTAVRRLFYHKRKTGRGIRLLGVGAQNLEKAGNPEQAELFDFGEKKRQQVEKALLELRKKNPKNIVKKARLLGGDKLENRYPE